MAAYTALKTVTALGNIVQSTSRLLLPTIRTTIGSFQPVRLRRSKHWNPKWKKLRGAKVIKMNLPNFQEETTQEKARAKLKERGLFPPRPWSEKQFFISCTGTIVDEYVPPEGDGKFSSLSTTGAKQRAEFIGKKGKTLLDLRKIKSYDEEFTTTDFPERAQEIYIKAHEALMTKDDDLLNTYVTEKAFPQMKHNSLDKTIRWKFLGSLEPPRVVAVKCTTMVTDKNYFAQVTVRFHTQQSLAIYDRFGRLMCGSEIVKKDVLEYVVFERHLTYEYGSWRLHGKILPPWAPPREFGERTYIEKPQEPEPEKPQKVSTVTASTGVDPSLIKEDLPEVKARPIV